MDGALEIVKEWPHEGQGAFFVFVIVATIIAILGFSAIVLHYCTVLFRGWPPREVRNSDPIDPVSLMSDDDAIKEVLLARAAAENGQWRTTGPITIPTVSGASDE